MRRNYCGVMSHLLKHVIRRADFEIAGCLNVQLFDNTVIHDHRETLSALTHAKTTAVHGQAQSFGEISVAIVEHRNGL